MCIVIVFVKQVVTSKFRNQPSTCNLAVIFYLTKKLRQKPKDLEKEKSFEDEIKSSFHQF